ncbi:MAG: hypothetical protein LUQ57_00905, partial [Methylococcaceae bacterium]|nr:hypothetical protein [Methylococcaceae bacterium]
IWDFLAALRSAGTDLKKTDSKRPNAGMNSLDEQLSGWSDTTETREAEQNNQMLGAMLNQSINEILVIDSQTLHFRHVKQ